MNDIIIDAVEPKPNLKETKDDTKSIVKKNVRRNLRSKKKVIIPLMIEKREILITFD